MLHYPALVIAQRTAFRARRTHNDTTACSRERGRLAEALKALQVGAGLGGARLTEMLGRQQSKVPGIATRKQLPSEGDIAAWVGAVGATPETASDLLAMLRDAPGRVRGVEGRLPRIRAGGVQADILELERRRPESPPMTDEYWYPLYERTTELDVPAMIHVSSSCNPTLATC